MSSIFFIIVGLSLLLTLLDSSAAFALRQQSIGSPESSALWGFRQNLKTRIVRTFTRKNRRSLDDQEEGRLSNKAETSTIVDGENDSPFVSVPVESRAEKLSTDQSYESASPTATVSHPVIARYSTQTELVRLPPIDRPLSELELEFRDMLGEFASYSTSDIVSIREPKVRSLFEGIIASADEPLVYRAFEVLFEDLYPLRVGGRLIYRKLKKIMERSVEEQEAEVAHVVTSTGQEETEVRRARLSYMAVAMSLNGDSYLTSEQIRSSAFASTIVDQLGFEHIDGFLESLDSKEDDKYNFSDLILGVYSCAQVMCVVEGCNPPEVVHELVVGLIDHPATAKQSIHRRDKIAERYDDMVESFRGWEGLVPSDENLEHMGRRQGRILEVVLGCFQGAKNEAIVDALKVLYVDYNILRVAGDVIFALVSKMMKRRLNSKTVST